MTRMSSDVDAKAGRIVRGSDKKYSVRYADTVVNVICEGCGEAFTPKRKRDLRRPRHGVYCSRRCASRGAAAKSAALYPQSGDQNHNFKGWRSRTPYVYTKAFKVAHPEIVRAHRIVAEAIRKGLLVRPEFCDSCFLKRKIDAHHDDYTKQLAVQWLCRKCHIARDKQLAEERLRRAG